MKNRPVVFALFCSLQGAALSASYGDIITEWTFETSPPADLIDSATIGGIAADTGSGTASGVHAGSATDWTTPSGNGSANSLSSNTWAVGDYLQFSSATTGFEDIVLGWAQTSSGTGPGQFKLAYQVNGGGYTDFLDYTVLPNQVAAPGPGATWTAGVPVPAYNFSVDLSSVTGLNDAASVDFRLIMRTTADATPPGTVAAAGTDRVDNFTINGTVIEVIPEPTSLALLGVIGFVGAAGRRFRKRSIA